MARPPKKAYEAGYLAAVLRRQTRGLVCTCGLDAALTKHEDPIRQTEANLFIRYITNEKLLRCPVHYPGFTFIWKKRLIFGHLEQVVS